MAGTPTQQKIDMMFEAAEAGDLSAVQWLISENAAMAKRANSRLDYLDKRGDFSNTGAKKQAEYWLGEQGREHFSTSKKMDLDDMREQMEASGRFLRSQTSRVRGEELRRENIYESLKKGGYISPPEDEDEEAAYKRSFNEFLSSDAFDELKKNFGSGIISGGSEAIQKGFKVSDLTSLYDQYIARTDKDIFQVWHGWLEGKTSF